MRRLPEAHRYFIIWNWNYSKTHLCYPSFEFGNIVIHQACMPNMPVEVKVGPCGDSSIWDMDLESASFLDEQCEELTCPTCLRMAQGEPQAIMQINT